MKNEFEYRKYNKETWNKKTQVHLNSEFYDVNEFKKGGISLNDIERKILGDINGLKVLHLQCHFGQDTLSLARLGAKTTGVDLSDRAIEEAKKLAGSLEIESAFICCDLYELREYLDEKFDLVFTSYGTVGWLPDLDRWASIISHFLSPGGRFVMADFHPFVWMFDYDFNEIEYGYFNNGPIVETFTGTYADPGARIEQKTVTWTHSLSEIISGLIKSGLRLQAFEEYDYSPYDVFRGTKKVGEKKYIIEKFSNKVPLIFAIEARKEMISDK